MKITIFSLLFLALMAGSVSAQRLIVGEYDEPRTLNPLYSRMDVERRIRSLIFRPAAGFDESDEPKMFAFMPLDRVPDDRPQKEWLLTLRREIMWHDNQNLSDKDLLFSRAAAMSPKSNYARMVSVIGLEYVPPDKIKVTQTAPTTTPVPDLMFPLMPAHQFSSGTDRIREKDPFGLVPKRTIGCGPYVWSEASNGLKDLLLNRFEPYGNAEPWPVLPPAESGWRRNKRIEDIEIHVIDNPNTLRDQLRTGNVTLIPAIMPYHMNDLKSAPNVEVYPVESRNISCFVYNQDTSPGKGSQFLKDQCFREALDWVIPREELLRTVYGSSEKVDEKQLLTGPYIAEKSPNVVHRKYNVEKAREVLRKGGYVIDNTASGHLEKFNIPVKIRVTTWVRDLNLRTICETYIGILRDSLKIEIANPGSHFETLTTFENKVINNHDFDIAFDYLTFEFSRQSDFVYDLLRSEGRDNYFGYKNRDLDQKLDVMYNPDEDIRVQAIWETIEILHRDVPCSWLFYIPRYAAYRRDKLRGFWPVPSDYYSAIHRWYIEE